MTSFRGADLPLPSNLTTINSRNATTAAINNNSDNSENSGDKSGDSVDNADTRPSNSDLPNVSNRDLLPNFEFNPLDDFTQTQPLPTRADALSPTVRDPSTAAAPLSDQFSGVNAPGNDLFPGLPPPLHLPSTYSSKVRRLQGLVTSGDSSNVVTSSPNISTDQPHHHQLMTNNHSNQQQHQQQYLQNNNNNNHTEWPLNVAAANPTNQNMSNCQSPMIIAHPTPSVPPHTPYLSMVTRDPQDQDAMNPFSNSCFPQTSTKRTTNEPDTDLSLAYNPNPSTIAVNHVNTQHSPFSMVTEMARALPSTTASNSTSTLTNRIKPNERKRKTSTVRGRRNSTAAGSVGKTAGRKRQTTAKAGKQRKIKLNAPNEMDMSTVTKRAESGRDVYAQRIESKIGSCSSEELREAHNQIIERAWNVTEDEKVKQRNRKRREIPIKNSNNSGGASDKNSSTTSKPSDLKIDSKDASRLEAALSRYRKDVLIQVLLEELKVVIKDKLILKKALNECLPNLQLMKNEKE